MTLPLAAVFVAEVSASLPFSQAATENNRSRQAIRLREKQL
ncbi:MAG: hypothetical protein OXS28_16520 [Gammaproteobacteria bacterium]|nr:hypothetical protein [Gammaproteobacteria bacterium]